jgi:hypothetical protein
MIESYFRFKDYTLWLRDGFLIAFELLVFKEIQSTYKDSIQELNEFKIKMADDALYMIVIESFACIDFDDEFPISESTRQVLLTVIENVLEKASTAPKYLTASNMKLICNEAKDYLVEQGKMSLIKYPEVIETLYIDPLPLENYIHAFQLIKLLFKGEIRDSDRNGILV